jgi:hypothetical protein
VLDSSDGSIFQAHLDTMRMKCGPGQDLPHFTFGKGTSSLVWFFDYLNRGARVQVVPLSSVLPVCLSLVFFWALRTEHGSIVIYLETFEFVLCGREGPGIKWFQSLLVPPFVSLFPTVEVE